MMLSVYCLIFYEYEIRREFYQLFYFRNIEWILDINNAQLISNTPLKV